MSKIFAIYAYEAQYEGLHGINESCIIECKNLNEACEIGREMSISVIESFELEPWIDLEEEEIQGWTDSDYEDALNESIMYDIFEVVDTKSQTIEEMDEEFWNDRETFIEERCISC